MTSVTYSELTFSDPNPVKRFLQRRRLITAIRMAKNILKPRAILDFGAGNGELCKLLRPAYPSSQILCYEPTSSFMREARENLQKTEEIDFLSDLGAIAPRSIDLIFCLEVFEHLPAKEMAEAFDQIAMMLSDDGGLIMGVPVEIGIPAVYKGLFRMVRRYGSFDATPKNVLACAVGRPPKKRPTIDIGNNMNLYRYHVGFDHRRLRSRLSEVFDIERDSGWTAIDAEVYFLCRLKVSRTTCRA